ncbi:MAG: DUF2207 domain-containing protein [Firmicutes bacterium]|nr:DUF2207 domain-containing protein [Bacillota bacterium]
MSNLSEIAMTGRQKNSRSFVFSLIVLLCLLLQPGHAAARSYHFARVSITAEIAPSGQMRVSEERTAKFSGQYHGMFMWLKTPPPTSISDVTVAENGIPYTFNPGNTYGPAGTYFLRDEGDRLYVDWSFAAADEERTFTISYCVNNVVRVHNDVAELYYQFIGDAWETHADSVSITLQLPPGAASRDIRAWGHGPLHGKVEILTDGTVSWQIDKLPARTYLEGRVTFPPSLVPQAVIKTGKTALPQILQEEEQLAAAANTARSRSRMLVLLAALIVAGSLITVFGAWLRYGKEFTPKFDGDYYRELPADYTPAELGVLWRFGKPAPEDLTATLVDLARKGYLKIEEISTEKRGLWGRTKQDYKVMRTAKDGPLRDHEKKLLAFLFNNLTADGQFTFTELENYVQKNRLEFYSFWSGWQDLLAARGSALGFFDKGGEAAKAALLAIGVIAFFAGVVVLVATTAAILCPALLAAGVIFFIGSYSLRHRSRRGAEDFARWRAFRRFLLDFSNLDRHTLPSLAVWEHYLVYAITLGVASEVIRQLQLVYPQPAGDGHHFGHGWLLYGTHSGHTGSLASLTKSLNGINAGIANTIRTAASRQSSGSGRGGGFSGGGFSGGGFGGGGGGAR